MVPTRFLRGATPRRGLAAFALLALAATIGACKTYVFLPVDVSYEKISPPYVVRVVNDTGAPFDVRPSSTGAQGGFPTLSVQPGGSFRAILQLRRITVGTGSSVPGVQVLDNPYFEQAPPDMAELRLIQNDPHSLLISIRHLSWFDEYVSSDAAPAELVVPLHEFSRTPLFPRGPQGGP